MTMDDNCVIIIMHYLFKRKYCYFKDTILYTTDNFYGVVWLSYYVATVLYVVPNKFRNATSQRTHVHSNIAIYNTR